MTGFHMSTVASPDLPRLPHLPADVDVLIGIFLQSIHALHAIVPDILPTYFNLYVPRARFHEPNLLVIGKVTSRAFLIVAFIDVCKMQIARPNTEKIGGG